jgi:V8-like Glu-specific endopeptidase
LATAGVGCSATTDPGTGDGVEEGLVGGTDTTARPEIGKFSRGCTATLIAPHYVLTAGHCTGYETTVSSSDRFMITDTRGTSHSYTIDRIHIFGAYSAAGAFNEIAFEYTPDNVGTNDVALLHLSSDVPADVATPATIAKVPPSNGDRVTIFGFGCKDRNTRTGGGSKQYISFNYGTTSTALCPGDSGGPVVYGNFDGGGQIWGTNTGYLGSGADVFGNVSYFNDQIVQVMRNWDNMRFENGIDRYGGDYRNFELTDWRPETCRDACVADAACHGFTYVNPGVQSTNAMCWLKSGVSPWSSCASCTSGTRFEIEAGIDRSGSDYSAFDLLEARPELCTAACARDRACRAYTYVAPGVQGPNARCWLKSGVPAATSNAQTSSGVNRGLEINTDRPGKDYRSFDLPSADPLLCREECATDSACKAFTYVAAAVQGTHARCWLKSAVPAPIAGVANVISGFKRGLEANTDRSGGDYREFEQDVAVPEVCQATCANESACAAFTYVPPGRQTKKAHCWLKSSIPTATSNEGMVSGLKGLDFF